MLSEFAVLHAEEIERRVSTHAARTKPEFSAGSAPRMGGGEHVARAQGSRKTERRRWKVSAGLAASGGAQKRRE